MGPALIPPSFEPIGHPKVSRTGEGGTVTPGGLMFQVLAAIIILLTTAIGWVAIALAARQSWKQHKQARRPS